MNFDEDRKIHGYSNLREIIISNRYLRSQEILIR